MEYIWKGISLFKMRVFFLTIPSMHEMFNMYNRSSVWFFSSTSIAPLCLTPSEINILVTIAKYTIFKIWCNIEAINVL